MFTAAFSYILNRVWIDKSKGHIPTYQEITGDVKVRKSDEQNGEEDDGHEHEQLFEDDDDFEEVADEFEQSYNFRFEEALVLFFFYNTNFDIYYTSQYIF